MSLNRLLVASLIFVSPLAMAEPVTYKVDEAHASIVFKANHLGFAYVYGKFGTTEGTINWDEKAPEKSTFEIKTKAESLNTLNSKRDDHLRGPDFFNAKQFPEIVLKSKSIKKAGKNKYNVTADLTMLGKTKPISFVWTQMKTGKDPWGNERTGGETTFKVKRSDWGMTYMTKPGEISDEIELLVSLEAVKQ